MTLPTFKVNSKPTMTEDAVNALKKDGTGSKFINEPGTYDMVIKGVTFKSASEKDNAWLGTSILLETSDGKNLNYYIMIPTECRNSYLFGAEKQTFAIDKLRAFFRGLGIVFDFDNGMEQVAALFGDVNKLVGKTLKVRLGYDKVHAKYIAKDQYQLVDRDNVTPKLEGTYPNKSALAAAARDAGIKGYVVNEKGSSNNDFIGVLEIFSSSEPLVDLNVSAADDSELPF